MLFPKSGKLYNTGILKFAEESIWTCSLVKEKLHFEDIMVFCPSDIINIHCDGLRI